MTMSQVPIDHHAWYKLHNAGIPGSSLDVVNDGNQQIDARLKIVQDGNYSGQYWQIRPSATRPGLFNLCTMWLTPAKSLDVYGDDMTTPHLITSGNFSGQQWSLRQRKDGTWRLRNEYSGDLVLAADQSGRGLRLVAPESLADSGKGDWVLERYGPITTAGFEIDETEQARL